jgi:small multidrug resistance family-3 protein
MKIGFALLLLTLAAALEVGGDATIRRGLHGQGLAVSVGLIIAGGVVLTLYGVFVNLPPWDFGRLLGIYVVLFFVMAQFLNYVAFGISPTLPVLLGGACIVVGGLIMTLWRG